MKRLLFDFFHSQRKINNLFMVIYVGIFQIIIKKSAFAFIMIVNHNLKDVHVSSIFHGE